MRSLHKEWQNDRGGKWTARIRWYEDDASIRLKFETVDGIFHKIYKRPEEESLASAAWEKFKVDHKKK